MVDEIYNSQAARKMGIDFKGQVSHTFFFTLAISRPYQFLSADLSGYFLKTFFATNLLIKSFANFLVVETTFAHSD